MGIKDLWTILTPFCERKPLNELHGKTVAVDLSCWVCEAKTAVEYSVQPRMYLRNLYFRTSYLLLMDVTPVFVLEGKAPTMKYQTISDRNALQFKGCRPKTDKTRTCKDRTRFNHVLKQCGEMLKYMGLACVQGNGEAEAMCAYLNSDGLVDGCISQDSDCFAYGAKVVYRNFSISQQGATSASGGAVDVYNIERAVEALDFGRNKIVALALLCGSDYNVGVYGVGKDSVVKYFEKVRDEDVLNNLREWRGQDARYDEIERKINDKNVCTSCGHFGKAASHVKNGCTNCRTNRGCDFTKFRDQRLELKNEVQIRKKAIADPNFPDEQLIDEFLKQKDDVASLNLRWEQPDLINFVKFTVKYLSWEEIYAFEKFLPILTRWQLLHKTKVVVRPDYIKKKRTPKGIPSYEIVWNDPDRRFDQLIPDEQLEEKQLSDENAVHSLWTTVEPQYLVDSAYPDLVEAFLKTKIKVKKPSKRKQKSKMEELETLMHNVSIEEVPKRRQKRKEQPKNTLLNYFDKKEDAKPPDEFIIDFDASGFHDEDSLDLSSIVDSITSRKLNSDTYEDNKENLNTTSFFQVEYEEVDLFEKTLEKNLASDEDDSFEIDSTTLFERLRKGNRLY